MKVGTSPRAWSANTPSNNGAAGTRAPSPAEAGSTPHHVSTVEIIDVWSNGRSGSGERKTVPAGIHGATSTMGTRTP